MTRFPSFGDIPFPFPFPVPLFGHRDRSLDITVMIICIRKAGWLLAAVVSGAESSHR